MSRHSKFHKNIVETKSQPKNDNIVNDTLESYIQISLHCLILATETDVVTNPLKVDFRSSKVLILCWTVSLYIRRQSYSQILIKFAFISSSPNANSLLKSFSSSKSTKRDCILKDDNNFQRIFSYTKRYKMSEWDFYRHNLISVLIHFSNYEGEREKKSFFIFIPHKDVKKHA